MTADLAAFASNCADPFPADHYGKGVRCAVTLNDGTHLPCVMLRGRKAVVDLAVRRIIEEGRGKGVFGRKSDPSREMVAHFMTSGNRLNDYEVATVTPSKFAIPLPLLQRIEGETVMSWTGFVFVMKDGKSFSFGTTFQHQFFDIPDGYTFDDVAEIHNHSYVSEDGSITLIRHDPEMWRGELSRIKIYRDKPFFNCFIDCEALD
jgi:hypothetical protein